MKRFAVLLAVAALLAASLPAPAQQAGLPKAEAQAFWRYISQTNPYRHWQMWPGKPAFYPGTMPHGALLTTYVNDIALKALQEGQPQMPPGAIIVKENYDQAKKLMAITTMYKEEGYDPPHNDWFYVKYSPEGMVMDKAAGKVAECINCHGQRAANDYLFTGKLGQPAAGGGR